MKYLLDTNVVCEPTAANPNARVLGWIASNDPLDMCVSIVTLAEIEEGLARLPVSHRRGELQAWRDALVAALGERLIGMNAGIARTWGALRARLAAERRTISPMDGFIAATAEFHGFTLVTRNEKHFRPWGGPLLNPWTQP